jgi:hypothetical protein
MRAALRADLFARLTAFEQQEGLLPGIANPAHRASLVEQLIDGIRRIDFIERISARKLSPDRRSPVSDLFDPIRAAILCTQAGEIEEAFWLTFLAIHCGRNRKQGWQLVRLIYAGDGPQSMWTWAAISRDVTGFRTWIEQQNLTWRLNGTRPSFGNHRRREHLGPGPNGTGAVVESYVHWIAEAGSHQALIAHAATACGGDGGQMFDYLYDAMAAVRRFGRLGRFDFLCMLEKLGLAPISPPHPYLEDSSGPRAGAKLLWGPKSSKLDQRGRRLASALGVSPQVIEDGLCNWQKHPAGYRAFRG